MERSMATKKMALGKGLGALLPEYDQGESRALFYCGIEEILPNRSQPRKHFDESRLLGLAESIEEEEAFKRLTEEFNISQVELATQIGKDRTTIANTLRLLKLPSEVRNQLLQNRITSGHARAILSLETKEKQKELCSLIIQKGLSVREAEALAKRWSEKPKKQ